MLTARKPPPKLTEEGEHILDLYRSTSAPILIEALAGTGKSTMLKVLAHHIKDPVLYIVFAKRNQEEAEDDRKDPEAFAFPDNAEIRTFNSICQEAWGRGIGLKLTVNAKKNSDLLRQIIKSLPSRRQNEAWNEYFEITSAVALAKSLGYVPEGKYQNAAHLATGAVLAQRLDTKLTPLGWRLLDETLTLSIKASYGGLIDFDDQVYMPALFGGAFPFYSNVLVDEGQDLNPCNHAVLARLKRSRISTVGDSGQSIYAFRGAVTGGMATLKEKFQMVSADLTVSFRCPKEIVKAVHWHRPQMKWVKEGGRAARILNPRPDHFGHGDAIICRNNAPLFKLATQLLSVGISVSVHGSDIGPRLIAIMNKLGPEGMSQFSTISAIDNWESDKLSKGSTTAEDMAECMRVFARKGQSLGGAIAYAKSLFAQKGTVQLLTGHKSKGLEWETVYHLDPWYLKQDEQDLNLRYVIGTRSMNSLYEIHSKEIQWDDNTNL